MRRACSQKATRLWQSMASPTVRAADALASRCLLGSYTCACTVCSSEDGAESIPEEPEVVDEALYVFRGHTGTCACGLQ